MPNYGYYSSRYDEDPYMRYDYQYQSQTAAEIERLKRELFAARNSLAVQQTPTAEPQRVSRADRDKYIEHLANMFAEERLSQDEFNERKDKAMTAKFPADLSALVTDLPAIPLPKQYPAQFSEPASMDTPWAWYQVALAVSGAGLAVGFAIWGVIAMLLLIL